MFCSHCGGSNPNGAAFCQYCGSPLAAAGGAPLPSSVTAPPPPPPAWGGPGPGGMQPPPPRRRGLGRTVLIIIVTFVVLILVLGVVAYFLFPAPAGVEITGVNFQSVDNACGLNGAVDTSWYNTTAGQSFGLSYDITGPNATAGNGTLACTISSVMTTTPGFSITGADTPLSIAANSSQILSFTVNPPGTAYTGALTLTLT